VPDETAIRERLRQGAGGTPLASGAGEQAVQEQLKQVAGPLHGELLERAVQAVQVAQARQQAAHVHTYTPDELLAKLGDLRRENAAGCDIAIRPARDPGLVLVSGLSEGSLRQLRGDGLAPATVVQLGDGSHEGWLRLAERGVTHPEAEAIARTLAERHHVSVLAAGAREQQPNPGQWGRLAGFMDHQASLDLVDPERRGREQLYVLLRSTEGRVAPAVPVLLERSRALERSREPEGRQVEHPEHARQPKQEVVASEPTQEQVPPRPSRKRWPASRW